MLDFGNIRSLLLKELIGLWRDRALMAFVLYAFTFAVYTEASGISHDLNRAAIGIVDHDRSPLSAAIRDALLPPRFQPPVMLADSEVDRAMASARLTFALDIPENFQADVIAGRAPSIQLLIDATALMQAGIGASTLQSIITEEVRNAVERHEPTAGPVVLQLRVLFNQSMESSWFSGTMALINNITMLSVLLAGAALLREREHGTLEHILVMPVRPTEIMLAKILSNGLVILAMTAFSLLFILQGLIGMRTAGSIPLFLVGTMVFLFFTTSLGIFLGTISRSMGQLGLLFILVVVPMDMLSGGMTPLESMPTWLSTIMQLSPSTQFVALAQAVLYRGAGLDIVWPRLAASIAIGLVFFGISLVRFRSFLAAQQ